MDSQSVPVEPIVRARFLVERGLALFGRGEAEEAARCWKAALESDPGNQRAQEYLQFVESEHGIDLEAITVDPNELTLAPEPIGPPRETNVPQYIPNPPNAIPPESPAEPPPPDASLGDMVAAAPEASEPEPEPEAPVVAEPDAPVAPEPVLLGAPVPAEPEAPETGAPEAAEQEPAHTAAPDSIEPAAPEAPEPVMLGAPVAPALESPEPVLPVVPVATDAVAPPPAEESPEPFTSDPPAAASQAELAPEIPEEEPAAPPPAIPIPAPHLPGTPLSTEDSEVEPLLVELRRRLEHDDFSGALDAADEILERFPEHGDALRARDHATTHLIQMLEANLGELHAVPAVKVPADEVIWLNLSHREGFVLSQVDGMMRYEDILDVCGMPRLEALRVLVHLRKDGVIGPA